MSDKFRNTYPVSIDFVTGELPTADKMTGIARQSKQGLNLMEHAVGDLWNQSGDLLLQSTGVSENALMISNLARFLGAAKLANPRIPALPDIQRYVHKVTAGDVGKHEFTLSFPVLSSGTSFTWTGTGAPSGSPQTTIGAVISAGQWYVNRDTGFVYTYGTIASDWTLEYEPVVDGDLDSDATFNIIPDPDTDSSWSFGGLKIVYTNGTDNSQGYTMYLPPRGPLNNRRVARSPQDDIHTPAHSGNFQALPASGNRKFWQDDSVDGDVSSNAEHYRYNLPKIVTDASGWGASASIPRGLVYLWDPYDTGTIIEGTIFAAEDAVSPRTWVIRASGSALNSWINSHSAIYPVSRLTATSDHSISHYPSLGLHLVTVGSSIAGAMSALMEQFFNHDHSSSSSIPSNRVSHNQLTGLFKPDEFTPQLDASTLSNDGHPQYVHRGGLQVSSRDKYQGAMLGDFLLASTDPSSNYLNFAGDSRRILFGQNDLSNCGMIRLDHGTGRMVLHARNGSAGGVLIGDPDSFGSSSLLIAAFNDVFTIRPNSSSGSMTIGTSATNFALDIAAGGGTGGLELRCGDSLPGSSPGGDDVAIRAEDDVTIDATGDITITGGTDVHIDAASQIFMTVNTTQHNIILPLIPQGGGSGVTDEDVYKINSVVQPFYHIGPGDTAGFTVQTLWPDRCKIVTIQIKVTLSGFTDATFTISAYRASWTNDTTHNDFSLMGDSSAVINAGSSTWEIMSLDDSEMTNSLQENFRTNVDGLWIRVDNPGSGSGKIYPFCRVAIEYDNLWPWSGQTI